jgi:hypothetical protein
VAFQYIKTLILVLPRRLHITGHCSQFCKNAAVENLPIAHNSATNAAVENLSQKQLAAHKTNLRPSHSKMAHKQLREIGDSLFIRTTKRRRIGENQQLRQRKEALLSIMNIVLELLDESDDFDNNDFEDKTR